MSAMTKSEIMECLDKLLGSRDEFTISMQIKMKCSPPRRKAEPSKTIQSLADRFREMIAAGEYPFDLPVVATKDILGLPEFKWHTFNGVGKALKAIGGKPGGQIKDEAGRYTRVVIVYDHDRLVNAYPTRLESIYQRRAA